MELEVKDKGIPTRHSEGSKCSCIGGETGEAHALLVEMVNASYKRDAERLKSAPTSQTMRAKVLAQTNGHT